MNPLFNVLKELQTLPKEQIKSYLSKPEIQTHLTNSQQLFSFSTSGYQWKEIMLVQRFMKIYSNYFEVQERYKLNIPNNVFSYLYTAHIESGPDEAQLVESHKQELKELGVVPSSLSFRTLGDNNLSQEFLDAIGDCRQLFSAHLALLYIHMLLNQRFENTHFIEDVRLASVLLRLYNETDFTPDIQQTYLNLALALIDPDKEKFPDGSTQTFLLPIQHQIFAENMKPVSVKIRFVAIKKTQEVRPEIEEFYHFQLEAMRTQLYNALGDFKKAYNASKRATKIVDRSIKIAQKNPLWSQLAHPVILELQTELSSKVSLPKKTKQEEMGHGIEGTGKHSREDSSAAKASSAELTSVVAVTIPRAIPTAKQVPRDDQKADRRLKNRLL